MTCSPHHREPLLHGDLPWIRHREPLLRGDLPVIRHREPLLRGELPWISSSRASFARRSAFCLCRLLKLQTAMHLP